jgi:hypothetical protein
LLPERRGELPEGSPVREKSRFFRYSPSQLFTLPVLRHFSFRLVIAAFPIFAARPMVAAYLIVARPSA